MSTVSNPYTFNITKDIGFGAVCTSESTDITITVNGYDRPLNAGTMAVFYGYNNNAIAPVSFGTCSPSTYKGIEIGSIAIRYFDDGSFISQLFLMVVFRKHVDINKVIIDNTIFNTTTDSHSENDNQVCFYQFDLGDDKNFINYFVNNYDKQITITLEWYYFFLNGFFKNKLKP